MATKKRTKKKTTRKAVTPLGRVRAIVGSLEGAVEKTAWGAPTFRVNNRMFASFASHHHGDGRVAVWLNAEPGVSEMLVAADPERFFIPPYQGPFGWVGMRVDLDPDWEEVEELMADAHRYTSSKQEQKKK